MFSTNQVLKISCDQKQLKETLQYILRMYLSIDGKNRTKLAYQFTPDGRMAVGWWAEEPKPGWNKFPLDEPSADLLASVIQQFIEAHPGEKYTDDDGMDAPGYLFEAISCDASENWADIQYPFYGIFVVKGFNCFYGK